MKTLFLFILTLISLGAMAAGPVTLTFRQNDNAQHDGFLGVLDACQITADIHTGPSHPKYYKLSMVTSIDGNETRSVVGYVNARPDSTSICVTIMATDSATAMIYVTPRCASRQKFSMPTANCLLIDCDYKEGYEPGDTIPLMAYSTGILRKFDLGNGTITNAYDICGLRYSQLHPSKWHEQFKIPAYTYIEAIPTDKIEF